MLLQAHLSWNYGRVVTRKGCLCTAMQPLPERTTIQVLEQKGQEQPLPFFPTALFQYLSLTIPQQKPGDKGNQVHASIRG